MSTRDADPTADRAGATSLQPTAGATPARMAARGRGRVAEQILSIAFARGIKLRRDTTPAGVLEAVERGSPVPTVALAAVAEILSHLYAEDSRLAALAMTARDAPDAEDKPTSWT